MRTLRELARGPAPPAGGRRLARRRRGAGQQSPRRPFALLYRTTAPRRRPSGGDSGLHGGDAPRPRGDRRGAGAPATRQLRVRPRASRLSPVQHGPKPRARRWSCRSRERARGRGLRAWVVGVSARHGSTTTTAGSSSSSPTNRVGRRQRARLPGGVIGAPRARGARPRQDGLSLNVSHEFRHPATLIMARSRRPRDLADRCRGQRERRNWSARRPAPAKARQYIAGLRADEAGRAQVARVRPTLAALTVASPPASLDAGDRRPRAARRLPAAVPNRPPSTGDVGKIVLNLLSNAVKSHLRTAISGSRCGRGRARRAERAGHRHGPPPRTAAALRPLPSREVRPRAQPPGTGIGLALVRERVEMPGGEVTATSEAGRHHRPPCACRPARPSTRGPGRRRAAHADRDRHRPGVVPRRARSGPTRRARAGAPVAAPTRTATSSSPTTTPTCALPDAHPSPHWTVTTVGDRRAGAGGRARAPARPRAHRP